ncbi:MAG: heme-copper oxidase subunit III [Gemmatimonadales bacterium]|jgi:cytochrome c oxidase subunit 3/cytochrome o ubiquinol oxidase subunit 3
MTAHAAAPSVGHAAPAQGGVGVYTQKVGMWVFLVSEVMFFTALIGSYIILRWGTGAQWPDPRTVLAIPITALNTFILICSSVSMVKAYAAATRDDQAGLKKWLLLTVLGGATFVSVQAYEYHHLIEKGFLPSSGVFGSAFYTMTGFHGFHVTCGVISMIWVTVRAFRGRYAGGNYRGVETIGLYWHFVDLVWIILFTIVYLI